MSATAILVIVPTACYAGAAVLYFLKSNLPMAVTYFGYAVANLGLLALDR